MSHNLWQNMQNPILYALPVFVICIAIEAAFYAWDASHDATHERRGEKGYLAIDARTSVSMGVVALAFYVGLKMLTFVGYAALYEFVAPWHLPSDAWWFWVGLVVAVDLAWYCNHRFSHRVRIGWAAHQAHHSSEFFNFSTALRQKWNPWTEAIFWLPLPLLGVSPLAIYTVFGANLVYQFFSHTERIDKLWKPIEFVFNTPSHHRVHHGSDEIYLDKNYGGIFIVWDRMFGTFQAELHRPRYGLTKPVNTYNLLKLQYGEYGNIICDVRSTSRLRDKLGYVFGPPGWQPKRPTQPTQTAPNTDAEPALP